jgi:hypothetical protein
MKQSSPGPEMVAKCLIKKGLTRASISLKEEKRGMRIVLNGGINDIEVALLILVEKSVRFLRCSLFGNPARV